MSRELKFRGLTKDTKTWVYGYLFEDITIARHCCYIIEGHFVPAISMPTEKFIPVIKESVGQFIGLHDKNGKEVFEDDIIKSKSHSPEEYVIKFIEGGFCATINEEWYLDINHFYDSTGCCMEVIGNVYQNSDLLKEGEK